MPSAFLTNMRTYESAPPQPEPPRRLSQVTNQWETYYPPHKRSMKTALNMVAVSIMIFFLIIAIAINQTIEHTLVDTYGFWWALYVMHIEASIQIIVLGKFYKAWVEEANEWENHQTDTKFEDAKILKTFLFSSVNYGAVMYQAYVTRCLAARAETTTTRTASRLSSRSSS